MAVLILAEIEPTDVWFSEFIAKLQQNQPNLDLRVWPKCGKFEEIEIVLAWWPPLGVMQRFPNLKLIISLGASVDRILADPNLPQHIPILRTVSQGKTLQMVEYVTLAVLLFKRQWIEYQELQRSHHWKHLNIPNYSSFTIGVLGLGVLGSATAQKLATMGLTVRGWSRTPKAITGVECFHGNQDFKLFLGQCQVIVCLLPLTSETEGILCHETFSALPLGAYLINVGRGQHLVETDLLAALNTGQIAGACLDVFKTEPLPKNHPFWSHPRIIITPHIAASGQPDDTANYVIDVMTRYQTEQPLKYLIDRNQAY